MTAATEYLKTMIAEARKNSDSPKVKDYDLTRFVSFMIADDLENMSTRETTDAIHEGLFLKCATEEDVDDYLSCYFETNDSIKGAWDIIGQHLSNYFDLSPNHFENYRYANPPPAKTDTLGEV